MHINRIRSDSLGNADNDYTDNHIVADSFASNNYSHDRQLYSSNENYETHWYDYLLVYGLIFFMALVRFLFELAFNGCFACCTSIKDLCCGTGMIANPDIYSNGSASASASASGVYLDQGKTYHDHYVNHDNECNNEIKYNDEDFEKLVSGAKNEVENTISNYHE